MHEYIAYGLRIRSERPLPGFAPVAPSSHEAIQILFEDGFSAHPVRSADGFEPWPHLTLLPDVDPDDPAVHVDASGHVFHFAYAAGHEFLVETEARRVRCRPSAELSLEHAMAHLTGPILGFLLRARGITCLHASSVAMPQGVFSFLGPSGTGKSTLAAAFHEQGYPVVSDDVLALDVRGGGVGSHRAHTRLRLWPESVTLLGGTTEEHERIAPEFDKLGVELGRTWDEAAPDLRLRAIYVVDRDGVGDGVATSRIPPTDALPVLAANTYRNELLSPRMRAEEFACLGEVVATVPVAWLRLESGAPALKLAVNLVKAEMAALLAE